MIKKILEQRNMYLNYYKNKSALQTIQKAYDANAKDVNTIYWYGQALLANNNIKGAKEAYQKALQEGINDPWMWVGMGHVELMEGGDINAAKQKFEQAITATTETKGKNKKKFRNIYFYKLKIYFHKSLC